MFASTKFGDVMFALLYVIGAQAHKIRSFEVATLHCVVYFIASSFNVSSHLNAALQMKAGMQFHLLYTCT